MCVAVSPIFFSIFFFNSYEANKCTMQWPKIYCSKLVESSKQWRCCSHCYHRSHSVKKPVCVCSSFVVSITHCLSSQQPSFPTPLLRFNRLPKTLIFTPTHFTILFRSLCHLSSEAGKIGFWFVGLVPNGVFHRPLPQMPFLWSFGTQLSVPTTEHADFGVEEISVIWISESWFSTSQDSGL